MNSQAMAPGDASAVPLLNAVFCADCEIITNSPHDACKVCGSRSLLSLVRILGGTLRGQKSALVANTGKYNLKLIAEVSGVPTTGLHHALEMMTRLAQAGADVKSLHLEAESVLDTEAVLRVA